VNSKERYNLIKSSVGILFETSRPNDFATFEDADDPDEYVQFKFLESGLLAEVGSREWTDPTRPLASTAKEALGELGFSGGGPERNYANPDLPIAASPVAKVLHRAFDTAYGRRGADLVTLTNCPELETWLRDQGLWTAQPTTLPVAEPIRHDMLQNALEANGWPVFQDQKTGALWTFREWNRELGQGFHLQTQIEGEYPWRIVSFIACGDRPVLDNDRAEALELINQWNDEKRWPNASLWRPEGQDFCWLHLRWSLPAAAGLCQGMVNDVVSVVGDGVLGFYRWFNAEQSVDAASSSSLPTPRAA